jgi:hypothetical protein
MPLYALLTEIVVNQTKKTYLKLLAPGHQNCLNNVMCSAFAMQHAREGTCFFFSTAAVTCQQFSEVKYLIG